MSRSRKNNLVSNNKELDSKSQPENKDLHQENELNLGAPETPKLNKVFSAIKYTFLMLLYVFLLLLLFKLQKKICESFFNTFDCGDDHFFGQLCDNICLKPSEKTKCLLNHFIQSETSECSSNIIQMYKNYRRNKGDIDQDFDFP